MGFFNDYETVLYSKHMQDFFGNFNSSLNQVQLFGFSCLNDINLLVCIGQNHPKLQYFLNVDCGDEIFRSSNVPKTVLQKYCDNLCVYTCEEAPCGQAPIHPFVNWHSMSKIHRKEGNDVDISF